MATTADFVGRGIAFPLAVTHAGSIATIGGEQDVERSMRLVLGTAYGERPMRPEFGCRIHDMVFDPVDGSFTGLVAHEVRISLARWEPRIDVIGVTVSRDPDTEGSVLVAVDYVLRSTNDRRNLVFPFYSIPEEQ